MKIAVLFFADTNRDKLIKISKALAAGIESQGHTVDLIDGNHDVNTKLTIYSYIVVGSECLSGFGGKIPPKISHFLSSSGIVTGKKSFAFIMKKAMGTPKALKKLMNAMEKEGMFLKFSEILSSPEEAEAIGKRLHIG